MCAGAFSACVALAPQSAWLALVVAVSTWVVIAVVFTRWRAATACAAIAACALGAWRGVSASAVDSGPGSVAGHLGAGQVLLRGTVGDAGVPGREDVLVVDVHQLATRSGTWTVTGGVVVEPLHSVDVLPGDTVDVSAASLNAPSRRPGSLSVAALERVGVTAVATAAQVTPLAGGGLSPARLAEQLRRALSTTVARMVPEPDATILLGVAFGIHGTLGADLRTPLQDAGLIHVIAVSGLKVVMVGALVAAVARSRGWTRRRRTAATLAVIALYIVVSGAGAAALRSGLMVSASLLLSRDGRRPHSFALLGCCAALLLAIEPAVGGDVGFQLSFLGTAGILLLASPIAARIPGPRLLVEPFAVTLAAQLATAPVTAGTFGVLSLVGPIANAIALPLLPLVIVAGGAGALLGTVAPALGWLPLETAALVGRVILAIARGAAAMPFADVQLQLWPAQWTAVELAAAGAGALVWRLHERWSPSRSATLAVSLGAALLAGTASARVGIASEPPGLRVTVLDIGDGVAVLVRPPGGGVVLVDGGSDGAVLLTALGRVLSPLDRRIDVLVLTGTDRADAAATSALVGHYGVGTVMVSQPLPSALQTTLATLAGTGTRIAVAGTRPWAVGGVTVRCLPSGPDATAPCALQLSDGRSTALITGNLPQVVQDELAAVWTGGLRAQLLVGPTTTAPSPALLAATGAAMVAVPARRAPPGLAATGLPVAVTGHDSDVGYDADPSGGFIDPTG